MPLAVNKDQEAVKKKATKLVELPSLSTMKRRMVKGGLYEKLMFQSHVIRMKQRAKPTGNENDAAEHEPEPK